MASRTRRGLRARTSWHLGVLTDDDDYIGLEQVKIGVDRAVDRFADGSKRVGDADIAGEDWTVRSGPKGRLTFVRREAGITILVNGTASRQVTEDYVSSLHHRDRYGRSKTGRGLRRGTRDEVSSLQS